jgi:hypothetical protein
MSLFNNILKVNKIVISDKINSKKIKLSSTDYKIIKCMENFIWKWNIFYYIT